MLSLVSDLDMRFGLIIEFTECLSCITANNYSIFTNLHTLERTNACSKFYQYAVSLLIIA